MTRRQSLLAYAAFLVTLVAGSSQHVVGDGAEYFAMAWNLAAVGRPSVSVDEAEGIQRALLEAAPDSARRDVLLSTSVASDGRHDFVHFWLYPALAAPLVRLGAVLHVTPTWGFVVLNAAFLLGAFGLAMTRLGGPLTVLVFAGPILWWADKVHTEVFTFSILSVAILAVRGSPGWSMVAFGAAAAQNPPIAVFLPLTLVAVGVGQGARLRSSRFWAGAAAGLGLALLHPAYYLWRHGMPSLLVSSARRTWPSLAELGVVVWDPNLSLLAGYPVFALVVVGAVVVLWVRARRELVAPDVLIAIAGGAVLILAFAQTGNFSHGGTPGMSRYALWLVPLALPVLTRLAASLTARDRALLWPPVALSALVCLFAFHPRQAEYAHRPTRLAVALWTRLPGATNPVPEVFAESFGPAERRTLPVATSGCEKALLIGRGEAQGMWPSPCFPAEVPAACRVPARLCYANRDGKAYDFVPAGAAETQGRFLFDPSGVWGRAAEDYLRMAMNGVGWSALRPTPVSSAGSMVRAVHGVAHVRVLEADGRALVTMIDTSEEARIVLRPAGRMTGEFIDGRSGERLGAAAWSGVPGDTWELHVPSSRALVLLTLRASP